MINRFDALVRDLCAEIDYLNEQLAIAQEKEDYWRKKYLAELNNAILHGETMMSMFVSTTIKGIVNDRL